MADACWGSRDVFAVVEVRDSQELNRLMLDKIQRLEGVRETERQTPTSPSISLSRRRVAAVLRGYRPGCRTGRLCRSFEWQGDRQSPIQARVGTPAPRPAPAFPSPARRPSL